MLAFALALALGGASQAAPFEAKTLEAPSAPAPSLPAATLAASPALALSIAAPAAEPPPASALGSIRALALPTARRGSPAAAVSAPRGISFDGGKAPAFAASLLPDLEEGPLRSIVAAVHRRARHFVAPNEMHPADALPILSRAPRGAYVAVGTERGFIGAAASKATHLVLADRDPEVVLYNRVNRALMQTAGSDRQAYLSLRFAKSHDAWMKALSRRRVPRESAALLADEDVWSTWAKQQAGAGMRPFNTPAKRPSDPFHGVNYLHDNALYAKLSRMAVRGRIAVLQLDFKNEQDKLAKVVDGLKKKGIALSVLDLSNARQERYVGKEKTLSTIRAFGPARKDAVVLFTQYWSDKKTPHKRRTRWGYYGFRTSDLADDDLLLESLGKSRKLLKMNSLNAPSGDLASRAVEQRLSGFRKVNGRNIRNGVEFRNLGVATPDVLTLRIKRFFFDKILSGEKKFEYRARSPQNDALIEAARRRGAKFLRLHFQDNDVQLLARIENIDVVSGKDAVDPWDAAQGLTPSDKPHWRIAVSSPRLIWDNAKSRQALNAPR